MLDADLNFAFTTTIIYWRGPAPFFYAPLPPPEAGRVREMAKFVTYGWGMIPVEATINGVTFSTAMFKKNDTYYLPLKDLVRKRAGVTTDDVVAVEMRVVQPVR